MYSYSSKYPNNRKLSICRDGYVFTPVCQSFCSWGGVCFSACWDTHPLPLGADTPPRSRRPPKELTPPSRSRHPPGAVHAGRYGHQAGGTHPTGMHTCWKILPHFFGGEGALISLLTICSILFPTFVYYILRNSQMGNKVETWIEI